MRLTRIGATILFAWYALAQSGDTRSAGRAIYFLRDDVHKQWCGYASESRYRDQAAPLNALIVGRADYSDGNISIVRVTEEDESGDWAVYDEYFFDRNGNIQRLKRTINIIPEDNSEEQAFVIKDGKAALQETTRRELLTGKLTDNTVDWFKAPPVVTSPREFPFWTLITTEHEAVLSNGDVCLADKSK